MLLSPSLTYHTLITESFTTFHQNEYFMEHPYSFSNLSQTPSVSQSQIELKGTLTCRHNATRVEMPSVRLHDFRSDIQKLFPVQSV
jgi:hypothetical protein